MFLGRRGRWVVEIFESAMAGEIWAIAILVVVVGLFGFGIYAKVTEGKGGSDDNNNPNQPPKA